MGSECAPDDYLLSRDYVDCNRFEDLEIYPVWTQMFGYLLHPSIDTSNPHLKVADLGTGTACWLTDLSAKLPPTAQLDGFDLELTQAPPPIFLPSNVRLHEWDIFSEVPEHLVEQYDVVHVRLLVFVVRGEPMELLRKFLKLLKPGGWLQWGEPDVPSMRLLKADPSLPEDGLRELFKLTAAQDPRLIPQWPDQLGAYFDREGLTAVETHRLQAASLHLEFAMHQCNLLMYDMIASRVAEGSRARQIRALIPRAAEESRPGAMYALRRVTVVGRKGGV